MRGEDKSTQALERAYGGRPIPLPHPTPVYYGPHPCVLWSTPLCTMVHTPVYYGPHPCVLWSTPLCTMEEERVRGEEKSTQALDRAYGVDQSPSPTPPLCTMVHTPVYYGPHPCVLWSTPLCTMVHTPVYYGPHTPEYYGPHPCVLWSTPLCTMIHTLCTMVHTPVYYGPHP